MHGFCTDSLNDFECKCLPGYSGKHCNILPDGTVLPLKAAMKNEQEDGQNWALIISFPAVILLLILAAVAYIMCSKRRNRAERKRADAEAKRENELNAVNVINKTKMLDDHMIVNSLEFPKRNVNLADEEVFRMKQNSAKQLNTDLNTSYTQSSRCSMLLSDKLENSSQCSSQKSPYVDKPRLSNLPTARRQLGYDSSNASSCGASSVCSR